MKINAHFKTAKSNLLSVKIRTLLAVLGILVGTAAVVALLTSGSIAKEAALAQFNRLGTHLMSLYVFPLSASGESSVVKPSERLFNVLASEIPDVTLVAPYIFTSAPTSFENKNWNPDILGTTQNLGTALGITMHSGRFIHKLDQLNLFCVIGQNVMTNQLQTNYALGRQLRIGKVIYTIIGVINIVPENSFLQGDLNNSIIIPLDTIPFIINDAVLDSALLKLTPTADIDSIKYKLTSYFSKNLPGYKLNTQSAKELLKSMAAQHNIFTLLMATIGGISLLVGGIGVMNIMLAAVAERRQEIGLRLALGAEPKDIQWMFLTEAALLAVIGGGAGVFLGLLCTWLVSRFAGWTFQFYLLPPLIGFGTSVLICVFFGFYPSFRASKLNPIETLRGE